MVYIVSFFVCSIWVLMVVFDGFKFQRTTAAIKITQKNLGPCWRGIEDIKTLAVFRSPAQGQQLLVVHSSQGLRVDQRTGTKSCASFNRLTREAFWGGTFRQSGTDSLLILFRSHLCPASTPKTSRVQKSWRHHLPALTSASR